MLSNWNESINYLLGVGDFKEQSVYTYKLLSKYKRKILIET